jgi:hypothetical protein
MNAEFGQGKPLTAKEKILTGHIVLQFKNIGRTSAEIIAFCIETMVSSELPQIPVYRNVQPATPPETVEGHGGIWTKYRFDWDRPSEQELPGIGILGNKLWLYGYIEYIDFIGHRSQQRFCASLGGSFFDVGTTFWLGGPAEYSGKSKLDSLS